MTKRATSMPTFEAPEPTPTDSVPPGARIHPPEREAGKAARKVLPRSTIAAWEPASGRPDPVEVLEGQARTRVADLVPIRYGRMAASPFAFYRGAAAVMAWDLGQLAHTGLGVQLCGDAHLANFGGFAAPDRQLVFDLNDFDETLPGPFEWDLLRLGASFEIAARDLAIDPTTRPLIVQRLGSAYRRAMAGFTALSELDLWNVRLDVARLETWVGAEAKAKVLDRLRQNIAKAQRKDRFKALARLTQVVDGDLRFVSDPPLLVPAEELFGDVSGPDLDAVVQGVLSSYTTTVRYRNRKLLERYTYRHTARKVVGVGSVGTRCWVVLLTGRNDDDPLFLQVKQAEASVLEPYAGPSELAQHGERVVQGQSLVQSASDPFLGWTRFDGPEGPRDFYVRQLWDWKASAAIEGMNATTLGIYAEICGWTLARAHACSGDRAAIATYLGSGDTFDRALASFAAAYADQNERDHAALVAAIGDGRVVARSGI